MLLVIYSSCIEGLAELRASLLLLRLRSWWSNSLETQCKKSEAQWPCHCRWRPPSLSPQPLPSTPLPCPQPCACSLSTSNSSLSISKCRLLANLLYTCDNNQYDGLAYDPYLDPGYPASSVSNSATSQHFDRDQKFRQAKQSWKQRLQLWY